MPRTDVLIIGAGQAGLAMSRCLAARGIEHVLLERGRIAEGWRRQRWASLRLLTPNWMTRLPGHRYDAVPPGRRRRCFWRDPGHGCWWSTRRGRAPTRSRPMR